MLVVVGVRRAALAAATALDAQQQEVRGRESSSPTRGRGGTCHLWWQEPTGDVKLFCAGCGVWCCKWGARRRLRCALVLTQAIYSRFAPAGWQGSWPALIVIESRSNRCDHVGC